MKKERNDNTLECTHVFSHLITVSNNNSELFYVRSNN